VGINYLDLIKEYNTRQAWPLPGRTALLVIDMQLKFKEIAMSVLGNVISLVDTCTSRGVKIFFTRQGNRDPMSDGGMLSTWWGDITGYGSPEWELLEELKGYQNGNIIDKRRYNAFFGTELDKQLRDLDIRDIIICGVTTNCCCETTAREAFVRDYRVFFVADATATINEELHLASLKNLAYGFAYIVDSENIRQTLLEYPKMNS
jgi:isochorismate hydrolase